MSMMQKRILVKLTSKGNVMRNFNVLLTCCGMHISERIANLRNNEDGAKVKVYACNCNADNLPYGLDVEGCFVVPPIHHPEYISRIIEICKGNDIDIIIPNVTLELQFMADHKEEFEKHGIKVSIASSEAIKISNNKLHLYERYPALMPPTIATTSFYDLLSFDASINRDHKLCVKFADHCGGNGFAILDDDKARDMSLFNKYGENRYVSYDEMEQIMRNIDEQILVSEYINGNDYSISALVDNGDVKHMVGYIGHVMQFGAIEYGEIQNNYYAEIIVKDICRDIKLDGNVCFDFRIADDGKVYLLEVNPRVNASLPFVAKAGINMIYLRCKQLLGYSVDDIYPIEQGLKMKKYHVSKYFI